MPDQKRILIADDEIQLLNSMSFTLRRKGFQVTKASNGNEAANFILESKQQPFDLIITDIQMSGLTGLELIAKVKELGVETPILVISGFGDKELLLKLMRVGCTDFLDKPFDMNEFLERINSLIHKNDVKK